MKTSMSFVLAAALATSTANAAILQDIQGDVWIGRDKGFTRVEKSTEVLPGDKIKVGRKGAARLVYSDDCSVPVGANSLERVSAHSPCSFKALAGRQQRARLRSLKQRIGIPCDPFGPWENWAPCAALLGLGGVGAGFAATWGGGYTPVVFIPPVTPRSTTSTPGPTRPVIISMGAASFGADQGASRGRVGVFAYLAAVGLLSCLLLGGGTGSGYLSDAVLQLLSLPLLFAALWRILAAPAAPSCAGR